MNNPNFNRVEFDTFRSEAGHNYFTMTPKKWIDGVNAIGIISKAGKYNGGTYAHKDIALQFASWISPEINLYIIKEFQRLKADEQKQIGWTVKRELAKINYRIHTDAIKDNTCEIHHIVVRSNYTRLLEESVSRIKIRGAVFPRVSFCRKT